MFALSQLSLENLNGVNPVLVRVVKRAIELSECDFCVNEGIRSVAQQKANVAKGASKTMLSKHLTGDAVDLVPMWDVDHDGDEDISWDWPSCYKIATAMKKAANELCVQLTWGGVWDTPLLMLSNNLEAEMQAYAARMKAKGIDKPLLDGPHYEIRKG